MNVITTSDENLFTAFALLNTVGYNNENGFNFGEVRKDVRLRLATRCDYWQTVLEKAEFSETILRAGGALIMDIVPNLKISENIYWQQESIYLTDWQNQSFETLNGFEPILNRFYKEESINHLWERHKNSFDEEGIFLKKAFNSIPYRHIFEDYGNSFTVIVKPNLLDAKRRGYSLSTNEFTFLFLGQFDNSSDAEYLLTHELLHRWVDPIAEKYAKNSNFSEVMKYAKAEFPMIANNYSELSIWIGETVVRAATVSLTKNYENLEVLLLKNTNNGFVGFNEAFNFLTNAQFILRSEIIAEAIEIVGFSVKEWFQTKLYTLSI